MIYWVATVETINEDRVRNNNLHLHVRKPKSSMCSTTVNETYAKDKVLCLNINVINVKVLPSTEMSWREDDTIKTEQRVENNTWGNRMYFSCFTSVTCLVSL